MTKLSSATPRPVVFQYFAPVHVEIEDSLVCAVTVIDERHRSGLREPYAGGSVG